MPVDYHAHSNYSDGTMMPRMIRAARDAGLDGIGFADHCNVSNKPAMQRRKRVSGFNLDLTYERRRQAIERLRDRFDLNIYDAVEIDYYPDEEDEIRAFLAEADFDYVIGSVHHINGRHIMVPHEFDDMTRDEKAVAVDEYFDRVARLAESGLVDIAAHVDVLERNPALRGMAAEQNYNKLVDAFDRLDTVPEINGGRLLDDYGTPHPTPELLEILQENGVPFTLGTDAHTPRRVRNTVPRLEAVFADHGVSPHTLDIE